MCLTGKKLSDLERVTSLKVYNWFANRRKDIKRRANIGNVYFYAGVFKVVDDAEVMHLIQYILVWLKRSA